MPPQVAAPSSSPFRHSITPHLHIDNETCPFCERDIPPELLEEISGKLAAREREQSQAITAKLEQQFAADKAQADAKAKADLELERRQSAARETAAREEARLAAEAIANEKLAAVEQSRQEMQTALQKQVTDAETARIAAETAGASLQVQFQRLRQDSERALAEAKADAKARETEIHANAHQAAQAAVAEKLAAIESARIDSEAALQVQISQAEAAKVSAEQTGAALQEQLTMHQQTKEAEFTKLKEDAAADAIRIHQEATAATELIMAEKLAATTQAAADAAARATDAENKLLTLTEQQEATLNEQLNVQREILETAKAAEINIIKAKAFEDNQKQVDKLTAELRALEKKTNDELGEGAEINLLEALKAAFTEDQIEKISKVAGGADIRHTVLLHGKTCGTILYDSKNRGKFLFEHVTKLKSDQLADRADHAILSTHKFPKDTRHLYIHDGVVLASPARVVAVATLIRQHLILTHTWRVSSAERENKTAALYEFISSDRCAQYLATVDGHAEELLKIQVKEKQAHDAVWKKEGELLRKIQKAQADLSNEISCIIGTAADETPNFEDTELLADASSQVAKSRERSDVGRRSNRVQLSDL